mmetsp:Transcript_28051/g.24771  ORF Transcript_28051/g.24771 Transcript_28051/m.24771 type:complete len:100 (+) Transcript_28051:356-655(+)
MTTVKDQKDMKVEQAGKKIKLTKLKDKEVDKSQLTIDQALKDLEKRRKQKEIDEELEKFTFGKQSSAEKKKKLMKRFGLLPEEDDEQISGDSKNEKSID